MVKSNGIIMKKKNDVSTSKDSRKHYENTKIISSGVEKQVDI